MDGSSKYFVEALEKSRRAKCKTKGVYVVSVISDEESGSEILIMLDHHCVTTMVDFGTKILGTQNANMKVFDFKTEISESRTLSFFT
jgi:UDP-3-O-[3-hydroxymyristoyl] N-acetylglucosamine deacetylase/3-hydroxyacyl-[acyl-carrier-protein] dehydratase